MGVKVLPIVGARLTVLVAAPFQRVSVKKGESKLLPAL